MSQPTCNYSYKCITLHMHFSHHSTGFWLQSLCECAEPVICSVANITLTSYNGVEQKVKNSLLKFKSLKVHNVKKNSFTKLHLHFNKLTFHSVHSVILPLLSSLSVDLSHVHFREISSIILFILIKIIFF